ncbi:MAG: hypothetical protein FWE82_03680 [Defluviitaleaceae bacterium]|nr:hypothetical protein [Defluviitaleaceae bacterium]
MSGIETLIARDIFFAAQKPVENFCLISAKSGVHVYRCTCGGLPAVAKYFEREGDRREILNYRILADCNVPTAAVYAAGAASVVLEDISVSNEWRLGAEEDMRDAEAASRLAGWYFVFHENGAAFSQLDTLYFEYGIFTEKNFLLMINKFHEAEELFKYLIKNLGKLRGLIYSPGFTLTYNDFYWTNLFVKKDRTAAMMFDFNLMGRGYRYSDIRNVCSSLSEEAGKIFAGEYDRLYFEKHKKTRREEEAYEKKIDDGLSDVFSLMFAFLEKERVPEWAEDIKKAAVDGRLLKKVESLVFDD